MRHPLPITLAALVFALPAARAIAPQEAEFFEKNIRPVLVEQCYKCHGADKQKAALRVDSREAILKGSENGPVVVPGKPEESEFIKSIRHTGETKMPEKADKLPDAQIAALAEWVRMGLTWPEDSKAPTLTAAQAAAKTHWSYQPVRQSSAPATGSQNPIDAFIRAKLADQGLKPSPAASRRMLLRRVTFDLTGLPPTLAEIEAFEKDAAPEAWAKVVERLLASPRYGERWGRYWLDVARYADTRGYLAGNEDRHYAYSYTYRDWVICALNDDLPYDQFLIRQIAADRVAPKDDPSSLAALGFLTLGRRFLNNPNDIIDDRIDVVCRGTMGLTVVCARCHDHKFDPISQKDYYALYGVFASSLEPKELPALPAVRDAKTEADYQRQLAERQGKVDAELQQHADLYAWRVALTTGHCVPVPRAWIERSLDRAGRDKLRATIRKVDELNAGPLSPPHAMAMQDAPQPVNPRVFIRGDAARPGDPVPRRFLTVLSGGDPKPFTQGSGRLELAQAIASRANPLTSRVMVNRVWALHFGAGLVRTPGDFGVKGEPPTHPELLDYLAARFSAPESEGGLGWSLKKLHRLMLLSATYQQSSDAAPASISGDPENRLLSHANRRRLDFEATRDALLFASGQLDLTSGGRSVDLIAQPFTKRRTVYGYIDRQNLPGVFRTFDFASPDATSPQRHITTVPQQALFMLNSAFVIEQARALATSFKSQPREADIQALYARIYARRAEPAEVAAGLGFLTVQLALPPAAFAPPLWQYGSGRFDAAAREVEFKPLPAFVNRVWQGGPKLPDPKLGYVSLHAHGGHPGADIAAIRRWTAPRDGIVAIGGEITRESKQGNGVLGRIVSSRDGELLQVTVEPGATVPAKLARVEVKIGDTIDFVVESRGDTSFDGFAWTPVLTGEMGVFDGSIGFSGPPPPRPAPLSAWEKYAQVLLAANEFVFVD